MLKILKKKIRSFIPMRIIAFKGSASQRKVALTFDDGPHQYNTEEILRVLKDEGVKATFFVLGSEVEKFPMLAKKIVDEGHEIGNHSFFHKRSFGIDEIDRAEKLINAVAGVHTKFFRPPYGKINSFILACMLAKGVTVVMWTVDSNDSDTKSSMEFIDAFKTKTIEAGDILLFHEDYDHTRDGIKDVIKDIKSRGLGFATVSEILIR